MTTTTTSWRATLAALIATGALLLGACGDGDSDKADKDKDTDKDESAQDDQAAAADDGPILDPDAPEADSQFCKDAVELMTMSSEAESGEEDPSLAAAEALEPPDEIAADWDKLMATTRQMQEVDSNDPAASEQAAAAYQDIADEQLKVMTYLQDQCGINVGMPGSDTGSEAPPSGG